MADYVSDALLVFLKSVADHVSEASSEFENQINIYNYDHMSGFIYLMLLIPANRNIPGLYEYSWLGKMLKAQLKVFQHS